MCNPLLEKIGERYSIVAETDITKPYGLKSTWNFQQDEPLLIPKPTNKGVLIKKGSSIHAKKTAFFKNRSQYTMSTQVVYQDS